MKEPLLIFIFLLIVEVINGQSGNKVYKVFVFSRGSVHYDQCTKNVDRQYGLKVISAGCIERNSMMRRNIRRLQKLDKQNGPGWRDQYAEDVLRCGKQQFVWIEKYRLME